MKKTKEKTKEITVGEVKKLLSDGKVVRVLTKGNKFTKITKFIEKGILGTFKVILENGKFISVSRDHKFFTNLGWLKVTDIIPAQTKVYCEDEQYYQITSIEFVGKQKIVDITVEDAEHCYFGNGMLNHNSGKSLLSAHICANTQKMGGKAIVIDTETSSAPDFWRSLGVDMAKLLYIQRETVEDIFETIEQAISHIRKNDVNSIVTIIVDSVAGASTKVEMESEHGKDGYNTGKAIIVSKAMRKIVNMIGRQNVLIVFTNQMRMNLNAMAFGEKHVVPGGKGIPFAASVRIKLNSMGKLKRGDIIVGNKCKAVVTKNRMGPPFRTAEFDIYFDSGIADYASWLRVLKDNKIVEGTSSLTYKEHKFSSTNFVKLMVENPELKEELYLKICDVLIMKYKEPNSLIRDDVEIDVSDEE